MQFKIKHNLEAHSMMEDQVCGRISIAQDLPPELRRKCRRDLQSFQNELDPTPPHGGSVKVGSVTPEELAPLRGNDPTSPPLLKAGKYYT